MKVKVTTGKFEGQTGTVISENRGWFTVKLDNGETANLRKNQFEETTNQETKSSKRNVFRKSRNEYYKGFGKTASGNATVDNGDEVAEKLRGLTSHQVLDTLADELAVLPFKVALSKNFQKKYKRAAERYGWKEWPEGVDQWVHLLWEGKNAGLVRANAGNVLRGAYRRQAQAQETEQDDAQEKATAVLYGG